MVTGARRHLKDLEKKVLSEISRQEEHMSHSISSLSQQLELKKDELSWTMCHVVSHCSSSDSLIVLQECELDIYDAKDKGVYDYRSAYI